MATTFISWIVISIPLALSPLRSHSSSGPRTVQSTPTAFSVASIKPVQPASAVEQYLHPELRIHTVIDFEPNRVHIVLDTKQLILLSFDIGSTQLLGDQAAIFSPPRYWELNATSDAAVPRAQMLLMLQSLLVDRFKMRFHHETRDADLLSLTIAPGGPKLKPLAAGESLAPSGPEFVATSIPMLVHQLDDLAVGGAMGVDYPVVDKTGLAGDFAIRIHLSGARTTCNGCVDDADSVNLPALIKEQLGLALVKTRGQYDFIVLEHIEQPTEN